jgi:Regulator of chromosome condensation (RCC1) repeat/Immunoglobulin domain
MKAPLQNHRLGFWYHTACAALGVIPHTEPGGLLLVIVLMCAASLSASAQSFTNLDFEGATLTPLPGDPYSRMQFGPALPGWTGYCGTNVQTAVNYDNQFLDSAGISILDTNYLWAVGGILHRRYYVLLQTGASLDSSGVVSTAIAQTGTVPASASSIVFNASLISSEADLEVTFRGNPIPLAALTTQSDYIVLNGDVSQFAGQTGELRFTAPNFGSTQHPNWTVVLLDYIRFSSSPASLAPAILTPPQSQTANLGSTVHFRVGTAVAPALAYQWFFDQTNAISGGTNEVLELVNVDLSQSGSYSVVVSNAFGVVTSPPAILIVISVPPTVLVTPMDQSAGVGASADFTVSAAGSPPLSYQWFFNGNPIWGASSSDLFLADLQLSQAGTYAVAVTNAFGAITSSPATLTVIAAPHTNPPAGTAVAWGYDYFGESTVPAGLGAAIAVAAGIGHSLVLEANGTVVAWGDNRLGQSTVPSGLRGVIAIAGGGNHSLALKSGGTVVAWGDNTLGESTVPTALNGVIAIAAGGNHSLALKSDGSVVAWGANDSGQTSVPLGLTNVISIAAGTSHSLALKSDGTVVAWGDDFDGQSTVPAGLRDVVAIAAGGLHSLALKSDGMVAGWGYNYYGQVTIPPNLTNVIAIAAGGFAVGQGGQSLALKSDGTVAGWGANTFGQATAPVDLTGVIAITAGGLHSLAITGKPIAQPPPASQTAELGSTLTLRVCATGSAPLGYQWFFNGTNALGSATTNAVLLLTNTQLAQAGAYTVVVTNAFGAVTSAPVFLSLIAPVERRRVPSISLTGQVGIPLNLEYAEALEPAANWLPLTTVTLASAPQFYFDLSAPLPPQRFFRGCQSGASSTPPLLDLHLVPAITLTGAIGSSVRLDYINQFGPTDAWVTLGTVALTNTSQLYFDTSALGQPARLYRLVPVP